MHFGSLPYKTKQFFFLLIKLSIVVGAFYFIYKKLIENEQLDFQAFLHFLAEKNVFSVKTILFLLLLTGFNWFLEICKWKLLVGSVCEISFKSAMEQSLGALTASLFTPNRIGEYGAKAVYFPVNKRKPVLLLNLIGNMMQMTATVSFGCIGFYLLNAQYDLRIEYYKVARLMVIAIVLLTFIVFILNQNTFRIKGFSIEKLKRFIKNLPIKISLMGLVFSFLKYVVFSFQFYYLLHVFGLDLSYLNAMSVITTMYLLSSVIPTIFIFDVVIKGSVAVYLFSIVGVDEFTVLSIVTVMWLFNFVLPSSFGSYYVLNFNLPKNNNQ